MKTLFAVAVLAVSVLSVVQAQAVDAKRQQSGAIRFYDDQGNDRGYAWCLNGDCSYYTRGQCEGSKIMGRGWCRLNPYAVRAGQQPRSYYR